jgi:hypothetical protein
MIGAACCYTLSFVTSLFIYITVEKPLELWLRMYNTPISLECRLRLFDGFVGRSKCATMACQILPWLLGRTWW